MKTATCGQRAISLELPSLVMPGVFFAFVCLLEGLSTLIDYSSFYGA